MNTVIAELNSGEKVREYLNGFIYCFIIYLTMMNNLVSNIFVILESNQAHKHKLQNCNTAIPQVLLTTLL